MKVALAPDNRFVARAACRFFAHLGDVEEAHAVVLRSQGVRHDPRLSSSEIALSEVRRRTSKNVRTARRKLDRGSLSRFHLSELASGIATMEAESGRMKVARKLCTLSLADPAENAIAQIAWLSRNAGLDISGISHFQASSHEAQAWAAWKERDWHQALCCSLEWQNEQPFSSRPAVHGGMVAT
jgi:hypothetical protein